VQKIPVAIAPGSDSATLDVGLWTLDLGNTLTTVRVSAVGLWTLDLRNTLTTVRVSAHRLKMNFEITEISELRGFTVEWAEAGNFYLSRRNTIFHSKDLKPPFRKIAAIDAPTWKQAASSFRLAQRLLRFQVTNILPLDNGELFVTFDKTVGVVRGNEYVHLEGLIRPCRVLRSACAVDDKGQIFFGEYLPNEERGVMRIYKYRCGSDALETVYTFAANTIRHIHGIYFDWFTKSLFCLTGDDEHECQILRTFDEFQSVEMVGRGDESWRAVSLAFTESDLFYGTDAEYRTNHIYQLDRKTNQKISLGEVNGTVFYSKKLGCDLFFTTTAENAPSQTENVAAIWHVSTDGNCRELIKFKKDRWQKNLFQFGAIHLPNFRSLDDDLYFSLVAVENDDRTFKVSRAAINDL